MPLIRNLELPTMASVMTANYLISTMVRMPPNWICVEI